MPIRINIGALRRSLRPQRRHRRAVHRRGDARHSERRAVRLRRRPAADLRARQLLAQHHHARLRGQRSAHRRVRHPAPRRRRLRRHQPAAAPGDHRHRRRRVRSALRRQRLAHRRRRPDRHRRAAARAGREHADAAARAQPEGAVRPDQREVVRAEDQGSDPRGPDREALHEEGDLHDLLQPDVSGPRRLRRSRRRPGSTSTRPTSS